MQLKSSGKLNREELTWLPEAVGACLLGAGMLAVLVSAFGLRWSPAQAFTGTPLRGLLSVWDSIANQLGRTDYIILQRYAEGIQTDGSPAPQGLFLTMALVLLILLAWLILRSGNRWLLLIYILPVTALLLLTETAPGIFAGTFFAGAVLCGFAISFPAWRMLLPVIVLVLTLGIGQGLSQADGLQHPGWQQKTAAGIEQILHGRYGHSPLGNGTLNQLEGKKLTEDRGSLDTVLRVLKEDMPDRTDVALQVQTERLSNSGSGSGTDEESGSTGAPGTEASDTASSWYLRGYIGEIYEGNRWANLSNSVCYEERDQLYWLNRQGFDGLSQLAEAAQASGWLTGATGAEDNAGDDTGGSEADFDRQLAADSDVSGQTMLKIRAQHADRSLVYQPYETTGTDGSIPEGTQNYAGAYLKTDRMFGSRKYDVPCTANMTGAWTDWVGRLYDAKQTELLQTYFINESHYNVWCYEQYTQVPESLNDLLYTLVGSTGDISREHAPYRETIETIQNCLKQNFIYSENFEALPEKEDFLQDFIRSGKGCDVHYASLATELFRYYGIPARYVEGYLITPQDGQKVQTAGSEPASGTGPSTGTKAGQPLDICYSHAHAWTEIYIDGYGWVPVEVTPEYRGIMQEADLSRGLQAVDYRSEEKPQVSEEPQTEADRDTAADYSRVLLIAAIIAGILLLLLLLWLLRHRIRRWIARRQRRRTFSDPDPGRGIRAMYGYMMEEAIPISERATQIGDLAAYSQMNPDEEMRSVMRMEMERGEHEKKQLEKDNRGSIADRLSDVWHRLRRQ